MYYVWCLHRYLLGLFWLLRVELLSQVLGLLLVVTVHFLAKRRTIIPINKLFTILSGNSNRWGLDYHAYVVYYGWAWDLDTWLISTNYLEYSGCYSVRSFLLGL